MYIFILATMVPFKIFGIWDRSGENGRKEGILWKSKYLSTYPQLLFCVLILNYLAAKINKSNIYCITLKWFKVVKISMLSKRFSEWRNDYIVKILFHGVLFTIILYQHYQYCWCWTMMSNKSNWLTYWTICTICILFASRKCANLAPFVLNFKIGMYSKLILGRHLVGQELI